MNNQHIFFSRGKLLITGEYFILDGAKGLALPTRYGQRLEIHSVRDNKLQLHWQSFDYQNRCWLDVVFNESHFADEHFTESNETALLLSILQAARQFNPDFLREPQHIEAKAILQFPGEWGLGSSSTLIYNIAQWANVNPYHLLAETFGGSGYDIAVAQADAPIIFYRENGEVFINKVHFNPAFREQLFFVHLNQKQNSREGIARYRKLQVDKKKIIDHLNAITQQLLVTESLPDFENLLALHENIIAESLQLPKVKNSLFSDYWGEVKSLGAWGGDFVLATSAKSEAATLAYFHNKGFRTVQKYKDLIFAPSD